MEIKAVKGMLSSNTFIVRCEDVVFIIDAGAELKNVKKALGESKPNAILLTHEHLDHALHVADYVAEFDCDVYAHSATLKELQNNFPEARRRWNISISSPKSFKKFHGIEKDSFFKVENISVEAITAPGHSFGCLLYKIDEKLFTGDVLFSDTIGRTDFIPNGPELMMESLKKLQSVPFETAYHGHGASSDFLEQQKNISKFVK